MSTSGTCEACPIDTTFDFDKKICVSTSESGKAGVCPSEKPVWNNEQFMCEACPSGQSFN